MFARWVSLGWSSGSSRFDAEPTPTNTVSSGEPELKAATEGVDSTGIPPRYANKAGFIQDTYGIMEWPAAFGPVDNKNAEDLRKLFKTNPQKDLPFRYGYPDRDHHGHMMITRRPG